MTDQQVTPDRLRKVADWQGTTFIARMMHNAADALEAVQAERDRPCSDCSGERYIRGPEYMGPCPTCNGWELAAENRRLADKLRRVREALNSLTDDEVWAEIDDTARATLRQHLRSIRGQMITPADGIEWHVMQEVRRRIKSALSTDQPREGESESPRCIKCGHLRHDGQPCVNVHPDEQPEPDTTERSETGED